jgi:hypothetical protein
MGGFAFERPYANGIEKESNLNLDTMTKAGLLNHPIYL